MPIQFPITEPSGAVSNYHVIRNGLTNFGPNANGQVSIDSFLDKAAFDSGKAVLGSMSADITPLVTSAVVEAPSLLTIIESFLTTYGRFTGGTVVE